MTEPRHISEFRENGFTVIPDFFSPKQVCQILLDIDAVFSKALRNLGENPAAFRSLDERYFCLKEKSPALKSHAYDLLKHLSSVYEVARDRALLTLIRAMAQTPLLIDFLMVRIDDPSNDRILPMHQEGLGQISYESYNLWMPLVPVSRERGTLQYVPGSHRNGYVKHRFYPEMGNYHGIDVSVDPASVVYADMNPGDVLVFHPCLFHGSSPIQEGDHVRWTLVTRYNSLNNVPYLEKPDAPKHIPQVEG